MRILDRYLIKRFITPFIATFAVVLFILVILTIWQQLDKISGKGLSTLIILRYLGYTALMVTPQALTIGILFSSIMAMGSLSEDYEYAAIKSAGISLFRLLRPLAVLMIVLSGLNFLFLNFVFPFASFESINLLVNMRKKQPAMALVAGSFNNDITGYSIKFSEKYGEKKNLLKDVYIYDLTEKKFNNVVITSKFGEIQSTPNSKYMTLVLKDGHYYKDVISKRHVGLELDPMTFVKSHFDEHQINFDVSDMGNVGTEKNINQKKMMMSLRQITEKVKKDKEPLAKQLESHKKKYYKDVKASNLFKDSTFKKSKNFTSILQEFDANNRQKIVKRALSSVDYTLRNLKSTKERLKQKKNKIFGFQVEYHNRISYAFACLVLFLIGAPLGSIINKGGFGTPMITAVVIYVIFHFIGVTTRGMADTGELEPWLGGWFSTMVMLPFGLFLNYRAIQDKGLVDMSFITVPIASFYNKLKERIQALKNKSIQELQTSFVKNSKITLALYTVSISFISLKFVFKISSELITILAVVSVIAYIIYFLRAYFNQSKIYTKLGSNYSKISNVILFFLFGMPFYLLTYFFFKDQLQDDINAKRKDVIAKSESELLELFYKKSKIAIILYGIILLIGVTMLIFSTKSIFVVVLIISLLITYLVYVIWAFLSRNKYNKLIKENYSVIGSIVLFTIFGLPFYLFTFFYYKDELENEVKLREDSLFY